MGHFIACDTTINTEETAELFRKHVWKLHGTPQHTVSDRGSVFNSKFLHQLYEILGIKPHTRCKNQFLDRKNVEFLWV